MKKFALVLLALSATLSGCGGTSVGNPAKGGVSEDTPESHLAGVKSNPDFSVLIQTPNCDSGNLTVRSVTYQAEYTVSYTLEGVTQTCAAQAEFLIDTRTSLLKVIEQCVDAGYSRQFATSSYSLRGSTLVVDGLGSLNVSASSSYSLVPSSSASGQSVGVDRLEEHQLGSGGGTSAYSFLCQ
jgi:hypothetical protein